MSDLPRLSAVDLRDTGYLAEANRRFFHPLGLAMCVDVTTNTVGVIDDRDDVEGWFFSRVDDDLLAKAAKVAQLEADRFPARHGALGYWVQPLPVDKAAGSAAEVPSIPKAHENEDGDVWWIEGHVSAEMAVLAVLLQACTYGVPPLAVADLLAGPFTDSEIASEQRAEGGTWADVEAGMRSHTADLLASVRQVWLVPHPDNDEVALPADANTPGAEPWTRIATDR